MALNLAAFSICVLAAGNFLYALVAAASGAQSETLRLGTVLIGFGLAGMLAAVWTRHLVSILVSALAGFLAGRGVLNWAIYLTDSRGEGAPSMWRFILAPSAEDVVYSLIAAGMAALGWWLARSLSSRLSRSSDRSTSTAAGVQPRSD